MQKEQLQMDDEVTGQEGPTTQDVSELAETTAGKDTSGAGQPEGTDEEQAAIATETGVSAAAAIAAVAHQEQ